MIPSTAEKWPSGMDPSDTVDYTIDLSSAESLLEGGELIASYTLTPLPDAQLLGFTIINSGEYLDSIVDGNKITFWCRVEEANRTDPEYVQGYDMGIELTIVTNSTPPRIKQRTYVINVVHK